MWIVGRERNLAPRQWIHSQFIYHIVVYLSTVIYFFLYFRTGSEHGKREMHKLMVFKSQSDTSKPLIIAGKKKKKKRIFNVSFLFSYIETIAGNPSQWYMSRRFNGVCNLTIIGIYSKAFQRKKSIYERIFFPLLVSLSFLKLFSLNGRFDLSVFNIYLNVYKYHKIFFT